MCCRSRMSSGPIRRGRHERWTSQEKWWVPTRSDFSRIAVINQILRSARSHLRDECPLTSKSVRLSAADAPQNASSEAARSPICIRSADEGCGSEHDNSRDECCHAGIRQDFIENSGHCNPPCGFRYSRRHLKATPAPWRKGEILRARAVKCA